MSCLMENDFFIEVRYCNLFQAINNLQSTFYGFGFVNSENVFKVMFLLMIKFYMFNNSK